MYVSGVSWLLPERPCLGHPNAIPTERQQLNLQKELRADLPAHVCSRLDLTTISDQTWPWRGVLLPRLAPREHSPSTWTQTQPIPFYVDTDPTNPLLRGHRPNQSPSTWTQAQPIPFYVDTGPTNPLLRGHRPNQSPSTWTQAQPIPFYVDTDPTNPLLRGHRPNQSPSTWAQAQPIPFYVDTDPTNPLLRGHRPNQSPSTWTQTQPIPFYVDTAPTNVLSRVELTDAPSLIQIKCGQMRNARSETVVADRIVGGELAHIADFPWQVGILHKGSPLCGGAILDEWWILSASHCFQRVAVSNLEIIHGIDNLNTVNLKKEKVDKLIMHPFYNDWLIDNDIALLLLKSPLRLGVNRAPICLTEVTDLKKWSRCWVTGWGATNSVGITSPRLHKVNLQLVEWEACFRTMPLVTKNMLCAGSRHGGKDACQGDSGGPLVCHKKKNRARWYQMGIVSWGIGCGKKGTMGVYTKVSNYLLWINQQTTQAGKPYAHEPDSGCCLLLSPWAILVLYSVVFFGLGD
ncbi:serine protease 52-like [Perognathus longimembris pacificus]|uniref:serine protease 52-like n=1 Tax=Perognathus longimembris pacificus TaxID=214514 RepID=UPI002019AD33|nr:serine protease 52-like [Perognathus longimembris pacificus]